MDPFERYLPTLEHEMRQLVTATEDGPQMLYGMVRYHLGWVDESFQPVKVERGKRLRPIICLLATEAQGGDWHLALPAATAIELLHNFTLIHDDIEDSDRTRRGRPTLWAVWGVPQAVNAGDTLFALSYRGMLALAQVGLAADLMLQAIAKYTETVIQITEGQCRDLAFETQPDITEASYLEMITDKTAALIALAAEMGGMIAGAPQENCEALHKYGIALGRAFQMQDDLLGLWGDPAKTGKPVGSDLIKRKKTLPILHALRSSPVLRQAFERETIDVATVPALLSEIERVGSRAYTETLADRYLNEALGALSASGGQGWPQETLRELTLRLAKRWK